MPEYFDDLTTDAALSALNAPDVFAVQVVLAQGLRAICRHLNDIDGRLERIAELADPDRRR